MRGIPMFNFQAFEDVSRWLTNVVGWEVVSPHDLSIADGRVEFASRYEWRDGYGYREFKNVELSSRYHLVDALKDAALRNDLRSMLRCEGVVLLDGWQEDDSAIRETAIAKWVGMDVCRAVKRGNNYGFAHADLDERVIAHLLLAHAHDQQIGRAHV